MSRRNRQTSIDNSRCRQLGLRAHSVRRHTVGIRTYFCLTVPKRTRLQLVVPSMILVQSSCHCSVFLMCQVKRHSVLAAASFTGNTYCWRRGGNQYHMTEETGGPGSSDPLFFSYTLCGKEPWNKARSCAQKWLGTCTIQPEVLAVFKFGGFPTDYKKKYWRNLNLEVSGLLIKGCCCLSLEVLEQTWVRKFTRNKTGSVLVLR